MKRLPPFRWTLLIPVILGVLIGLWFWVERQRPAMPCYPDCEAQNFSNQQFINAQLPHVSLSQANLSRANFFNAELHSADLRGANLREANLTGADLSRTDLTGADLRGAILISAKLDGANLSSADLTGATLTGVDLRGVLLKGATLTRARLIRANLHGAELSGADLSYADFTGADLAEAQLSGSNLSFAVIVGADLSNATLTGASAGETLFNGSNLQNTDLRGVNFQSSPEDYYHGAWLSGVDGRSANFSGANLIGADLAGSNFTAANFSNTELSSSTPNGAVFTQADLSQARFYDPYLPAPFTRPADLFGVNFEGATLQEAYLAGVLARGVNFKGANLQGAVLRDTVVMEDATSEKIAVFTGVKFDSATVWPQAEVERATPNDLTLFSWRSEDAAAMAELIAAFEAAHPGFSLSLTYVPAATYDTALRTALEQGIAADLLFLHSFSTSQPLFEARYLAPLNALPGLTGNFDPPALAPWSDNLGVPYAVPFARVAHGIYYNQDLFATLDLAPPTTWEELATVSARIKAAGLDAYANGAKSESEFTDVMFLSAAPGFIGGRSGRLTYLTGERCFTGSEAEAAFQAVADLRPFLPANYRQMTYEDGRAWFAAGKAAMIWDGSWSLSYYTNNATTFKWSMFAPPPLADQPPRMVFHPEIGIGLNAASERKPAARVFLEWLTTAEAANLIATELPGLYPLHMQAPTTYAPQAQTFLALTESMETDVRWPWPLLMRTPITGYDLMRAGVEDILNGRKTAAQAALELQRGLALWFEPTRNCSP